MSAPQRFRMRRLVALAMVVGALALTGCAQQLGPGGAGVSPVEVNIPDGRTVTCVVISGGGVDCDWDGAQ